MKKSEKLPVIALVFPDIFRSVVSALKKYTPRELDNDSGHAFLLKLAFCETERLVAIPAKDNLGTILSEKLERTSRYVPMLVSFHHTHSTLEEFERMGGNDAYVDVAVEESVKQFCRRMHLPYRK